MRTLRGVLIATLALALTLHAAPAKAQSVKAGGPAGVVMSASVPAPPGAVVTVFTTPATGFFLVTTACFPIVSFGVTASGFGKIPASDNCIHYAPGLLVPASSTITCDYSCFGCTSTGVACTISGVLTKK